MDSFSLDNLKEAFEQSGLRNVIEQWTGTFEHADVLIQIVGAAVLTVGWLVFQSIIRQFLLRLENSSGFLERDAHPSFAYTKSRDPLR